MMEKLSSADAPLVAAGTVRRGAQGRGGPVWRNRMVRAAREWVSFDDPEEDGRRWQIDVTFLLSRWQCIFGDGCQGVLEEKAPELILGCCSYGAHFTDKKDRDAVVKMARSLTDDE